MSGLPKVLLVGGDKADGRLPWMEGLRDTFSFTALGTAPALAERFAARGFPYYSYRLSRQPNPILDLAACTQLVYFFRRLRPDIVHAYDTKPLVCARLSARLAGVPVVVGTIAGLGSLYASNSLPNRLIRAVFQPLQALACRLSDLTIFQNHDDARQFVDAGIVPSPKATVILGSGVPTDRFDPSHVSQEMALQVRDELGIGPHAIVVTMISRVIRTKGVLEFMAAAKEIGRHHPEARFVLVGAHDSGSIDHLTVPEIEQLQQAVTWPGHRSDIPAVLAASDIFVLPSAYREGVPRALLEAAAMGLPLVTTDAPGCKEVVVDGSNGFLVPARDPQALSAAISRLMTQPELRQQFGRASRQRVAEHFSLAVVLEQLAAVYRHLLLSKGLLPAAST